MLELTRSQKEIQKAARDFAKGEFDKDLAMELDKKQEFPREIWEKAAELGFIGIHFEEEYLGGGLGLLENTLLAEELCRKDSTIGSALMLAAYGSEYLLRFGSKEIKKDFLPIVAEGKMLSAAAFKEANQGDGFSSIHTTAVKDGDYWVINGDKAYVTNGGAAGFYCVLCRTAPNEKLDQKPEKSLSMILVEANRSGVDLVNTGEKLGLRMTGVSDLHLENVRVPLSNLIGKEGQGLKQVKAFLNESRILIASLALGTAQGALDRTVDYVKQREQFGKKIAQFQITQHKLADMATKIELSRLITYHAAWNFDQGARNVKISSMAKMFASKTAVEVADEAIQLLGGYGYMTEYEVERFYRDAKALELFEGTKDVQKNMIAGEVIGKIR